MAARGTRLLPSGGGEGQHLLYAVVGLAIAVAAFAGNAVLPLLAILAFGALAVAYRDSEGPERAGFLLHRRRQRRAPRLRGGVPQGLRTARSSTA